MGKAEIIHAFHNRLHSIISPLDHSSTATPERILKANPNGLPVEATNTDAEVAAAVAAGHARQHDIIDPLDHTSGATPGQVLQANANGLPVDATNTDAEVADAVAKRHTQGTDTALGAVGVKNPPINADKVLYRNSAAADALVTSTWTQVKAFLKTYFDTVYDAIGSAAAALAAALAALAAHNAATTGVHGVGGNYVAQAPAASHLVRSFTKGWTANKFLKGAGVNADPSEVSLTNFVPIPLSRCLLLWTDPVSSTPNTAAITAKGASTITVTAGKGRYYYGNPTHSEMLIWNTTRAESAWVASRNVDVLTLTAAVPGTWQLGDNITNAYDGAASIFVKLKLLKISSTATAITCIHYVQDSGAPSDAVVSSVHFEPIIAVTYNLRTQVAGITASDNYILSFIQDQFVYYRINASGANTYKLVYDVMGYWEPA